MYIIVVFLIQLAVDYRWNRTLKTLELCCSLEIKLFELKSLKMYDQKEKMWYGRDIPLLYNPKINIAQALFNAMNIFGSKVAQVILSFYNFNIFQVFFH